MKKLGIPTIGILLFIIFLVPWFYDYRNLGNVTGMLLSCLLIWYGLKQEAWNTWIQSGWKKKKRNILSFLVQIVAIIILVLAALTSIYQWRSGIPMTGDNRTVVVLGCEVNKDGTPSALLQSRLDYARDYLITHPNEVVIVSGSNMRERRSEAESAREYLTQQGIPTNRIYMDTTSRSTFENLAHAKEIVEANQLNKKLLIATNSFHQARAIDNAKELNLDVQSLTVPTPWWLWPTYYIREMYAILYDAIYR